MGKINPAILCVNVGSSSIKASFFDADNQRVDMHYRLGAQPSETDYREAFAKLGEDLHGKSPDKIAHRFVHGGDVAESAREITPEELERLNSITPLAPLHLPMNLLGVKLCADMFSARQIACFDTAFHHTLPPLAKVLPIPQKEHIHRYGFHGLSYAYIATQLEALIGESAYQRVIIAHLGSGASLCLMQNLQSIDTTMGYTPAGGVCMGTRSGDLDPGVMLELCKRYDLTELSKLVNYEMGLFAVSNGLSSDMEYLLASPKDEAKFAVDYFCRQITSAIGSLAAKAGGVEAVVFTGGIGENSSVIRSKICAPLEFMGVKINEVANLSSQKKLYSTSTVSVLCIKTDEAFMMKNLAEYIAKNAHIELLSVK
ncbi:MAG: acetate kinase [Methylotenera sp.]|uniref:acetate/propionate family kinase n=1 Tax=Methylotenera sp. TaxID=2051956 RepID=UPI0024885B59|nr:acetate kinase [Methylotenera sp.]MDI1309474.1 acetate kinase [Methylotenera sp.]